MGRFFFHLRAGDQWIPDEVGEDLPNFSTAQREALRAARELVADAIKAGEPVVPDALVIADETGRALDTVPLTSVLPQSLRRYP
jgi:hypothetical protein